MHLEMIFFGVFSSIAVLFSLLMLTRKSALAAAICLIVCFLSFAGLYAMLNAPLIAALQVLVYAGAIMMLIIFVIMTVDMRKEELKKEKPVLIGSAVAGLILLVCTTLFFLSLRGIPYEWAMGSAQEFGTVANVGKNLFTRHVLNFEMISLLLLAALIGALVLGKKHLSSRENQQP